MMKVRVGVLFGGESPEHEVSIRSGETVIKLLNQEKYSVIPIGITRDGTWKLSSAPNRPLAQILSEEKPFTDWGTLPQKADLIFPCLHGPLGEDGTVQGLCELLNLPYVGCGVLASALGIDKSAQKRIFNQQGLPVLESYTFENWTWKMLEKNGLEDIRKRFTFPLFVKACRLGSSVGVYFVETQEQLNPAVEEAFKRDSKIMIEKAVVGAREFEVACMGNRLPEVSAVGETISASRFLDYEAKYEKPHERRIPAEIPESVSSRMRHWAAMAYMALDCKGLARVDFLANQDLSEIYLGEINTLPGFTPSSAFLKLWEAGGRPPEAVVDELIRLALELHRMKIR